jgi:glycosidase
LYQPTIIPTKKIKRMSYKLLRDILSKGALAALIISSLLCPVAAQQPERDFSQEQARPVRDWVRDGVIYEIFPRQFSAKGDFNGVTAQLDRLKSLGVTILWLMPIHPIGKEKAKGTVGSPYAVKDYYAVNPDYGAPADLKRLVAETHKRGMKIIIDIVPNHTAWDSVMMKDKSFYTQDKQGNIISPVPDWADVADLNYDNPALRRYMIEMFSFWLREYDLDGFRMDVAGFVPTSFWEEARAELDKVKPDILMLAEWNSPDLLVKAFELDYDWPLHSVLTEVLQGNRPASAIRENWLESHRKFPRGALQMRFSDNHDERRAIARFGERGALAAQALVFTLDGVPMLYNGMEAGDTTESGYPALFEKMPVFWDSQVRRPEFPRFYQRMIALRQNSLALRRGVVTWLRNSDEGRILTFTRTREGEEVLITLNFSPQPFVGQVETAGAWSEITPSLGEKDEINARPVGLPALSLDGWGWRIFKRAKN